MNTPPAAMLQPLVSVTHGARLRDHAIADALVICGLLGDTITSALSLLFGYWIRFHCLKAYSHLACDISLHVYRGYIFLGLLAFLACLAWAGVYNARLLLNLHGTVKSLLKGFILWLMLFLGMALFFQVQPALSPGFVIISAFTSLAALAAWRQALYRIVSAPSVSCHLRQRIVFVGWTPEAGRFARSVWENQCDPCEIVGYVDFAQGHEQVLAPANVPCLGDYRDLQEIFQADGIDVALLTDLNAGSEAIIQLATLCEKELVEFKIIPSYFRILVSGLHLETISGTPVLGTDGLPLNRLHNRILKRLLDICGACVGLLLAAPVIAIFGALVYIESPGPVFFSQERIGRKGRRFKMYKIRSMRPDAGASDHLQQSTGRADPRLLRVGAFMRRWNIDEVPQFWNVLTGEMSLVGPRPERTYHSEKLKEVIPHYNARYTSKPGVTGWAQVNGLRGDTDLSERIRHDIFYMENWSVLFDVQTMLLTFFKHKNAY